MSLRENWCVAELHARKKHPLTRMHATIRLSLLKEFRHSISAQPHVRVCLRMHCVCIQAPQQARTSHTCIHTNVHATIMTGSNRG